MTRLSSFALLAALLAGCAKEPHHPAPELPSLSLAVTTAHEEPLPLVYRASGTVRGRNTITLTSKTVGYVRAVRVHSGDVVTAGQPLVELEANDVRSSVARARAALGQSSEAKAEAEGALEAARAAAKLAQSSFDRTSALLKQGAVAQQQFDDAEAHWKSAVAQELMAQARVRSVSSSIDEARASLGEAQITLGYADIVAPFAGRVLERRVDPGTLASPGMPLLTLADEGSLRVEAAVEESHVYDVKVGDAVTVETEALPRPIVGKVGEVVPSVDVASRAFLVKIDLPPDAGALRPGTFARVSFPIGTRPRLVVPTTALTTFGALDRVFVVDAAHARLRMITRGEAQGPWTEVLSGLASNETVVAAPSQDLRDGTPVEAHR
jgi:RND family efflux transporter MFP subunit